MDVIWIQFPFSLHISQSFSLAPVVLLFVSLYPSQAWVPKIWPLIPPVLYVYPCVSLYPTSTLWRRHRPTLVPPYTATCAPQCTCNFCAVPASLWQFPSAVALPYILYPTTIFLRQIPGPPPSSCVCHVNLREILTLHLSLRHLLRARISLLNSLNTDMCSLFIKC